jgi:hypothetical protein
MARADVAGMPIILNSVGASRAILLHVPLADSAVADEE